MKKNIRNLILFGFTFILFFCGNIGVKAKDVSCVGKEGACCEGSVKYFAGNGVIGKDYKDAYFRVYIDKNDNVVCESTLDNDYVGGGGVYVTVNCNVDKARLQWASENNQCDYIAMEQDDDDVFEFNINSYDELPNNSTSNEACNEADKVLSIYNDAKSSFETCQKSGGDCTKQQTVYNNSLNLVHNTYQEMQNGNNFNPNLECYNKLSEIINGPSNGGGSGGTGGSGASCGILTAELSEWLLNILKLIRYAGPALLIILTIMDYIKAIASSKEEEIKKSNGKFVKRLIAIVLLFIFPLIIEFILKIFNIVSDDPFCGLV